MNNKILSWLKKSPNEYINANLKKYHLEAKWYRVVFVCINILSATIAAVLVIMTAPLIAGHDRTLEWYGVNSKPLWFYFLSSGVSAFSALTASLINFFVVKDKYQNASRKLHEIKAQIVLFKNETGIYGRKVKNRDYLLYKKVAGICGNKAAKGSKNA